METYRRPLLNENSVFLTGTAIHKYKVPGVNTVILTIATSGGANKTNYPKVVWYGEMAKEIDEMVQEGDRVTVDAMVQTQKYERDGERPIYRQNVVGRGIMPAKSVIEEAFGFKPDKLYRIQDVNEVRLAGTVLHMYRVPEREIVILTIRTYSGRVNHPKITLFGKTAQYAEETMNMGDPICAVGFLYTNRSEKEDGRAVYHEGITGTSISRIPEDEQPE